MRALAPAIVATACALLAAAPAREPPTATVSLVRAYPDDATPGPIILTQERRVHPDADRTLLRIAIDPPPVRVPSATFTVGGEPSVKVTTFDPRVMDGAPNAHPGQVYVYAPLPGHAVVTAHVGAPYNVDVSADVFSYSSVELSCYSPGESIALAVDAQGREISARGPAEADVYLALSPASARAFCQPFTAFVDPALSEPLIRFPAGAVRLDAPLAAFPWVSARDWKNATTEVASRDAAGIWLIRSRSGATIKLIVSGPYAAAARGSDFVDRVPPVASTKRVVLRATDVAPHFQAQVAADVDGSPFAPIGRRPGDPLIVGIPVRAGYTETLFGGRLEATVTPALYATEPAAWTIEGPLASRGDVEGRLTVIGTSPGVGRVTARYEHPTHLAASLRVLVYRTLALGCADIATGFGVAFEDDGTARPVDAPNAADLFASYDNTAFRCGGLVSAPGANVRPPTPFTPAGPFSTNAPASHLDDDAGWYFPYGGVFFPNGDDPRRSPPAGSPRGVGFDRVTAARWRNERTAERLERYRADTFPCIRSEGSIGYPIPGCTTMPDRVLLIRTRRGRYVKLLSLGRAPGAFAGLYEVSRADGTFRY